MPLLQAKEEFQKRYINEVLARNNGNRTKTAKDLGVDPRTIFRHLEKLEAEKSGRPLPPEEGDELLVKFILQEAKKLFAILVTTRHPKLQEAISLFQKHNFDDTKLPIKFWTGQMFNDAQHPFFEMQGARKKKVWDKSLIYDFQEKQWEFLAPVLSTEETYHCYGNHVIMPFVAQIASFAEGSFGVVSKYEIHEDHMVIKDASQQITKPVCTAFGLN